MRAEAQAVEELEALGAGLEGVPVPALVSDLATGTAVGANAAAVELLGTPAEQLIGTEVLSLVHPAERGSASSGVDALAGRAIDAFQVRNRRIVRADGEAVLVDISGRRLESEARPLALWVFARADQEIGVLHAGRTGEMVLAVTDHDWQLQYVSAAPGLLGTAREGLVGTALLGLVHPSAAAEFLEAASRAVADGITLSITTRLRSGKEVWTERECVLAPMCHHDPPRLGVVVTAMAAGPGDQAAGAIAAHVRHTAVDTRAAESLDTLAAMAARPGFPSLTARQIEMLSRVVRGEAVADIAAALFLSPSTVRNHLTAIYRKFGVHSRAGLLTELLRSSSPPIA